MFPAGALGFDVEWRPQFKAGATQHPVALLQLAAAKGVLCLALAHMQVPAGLPPALRALLADPSWAKVKRPPPPPSISVSCHQQIFVGPSDNSGRGLLGIVVGACDSLRRQGSGCWMTAPSSGWTAGWRCGLAGQPDCMSWLIVRCPATAAGRRPHRPLRGLPTRHKAGRAGWAARAPAEWIGCRSQTAIRRASVQLIRPPVPEHIRPKPMCALGSSLVGLRPAGAAAGGGRLQAEACADEQLGGLPAHFSAGAAYFLSAAPAPLLRPVRVCCPPRTPC